MKIDPIRSFFRFYLKRESSLNEINMNQVHNILVMSNTAIGDTLFATPAIRLIKKYYPQTKIIALLHPGHYQLFETNPYIDEVVTYRGKWRNFLSIMAKLKEKNIDLTLIMNSNEPQATPLAYCIGSKYIVRVPNQNNEFRHLHVNPSISRNYQKHTIHTRLKQLEYINIEEKNYQMDLFLKESWYRPVLKFIEKSRFSYVGMQVGASTPSRMWLNDSWIVLAKKILDYDPYVKIVLTGSPVEKALTHMIEKGIDSDRVINLSGKFNIGGAAALIDCLDLLITPDTGPLHMAAALKVPTIAISVAGIASSANPIDTDVTHIFIEKPKICSPCIDKSCKNAICMAQISVDEVFDSVVDLL